MATTTPMSLLDDEVRKAEKRRRVEEEEEEEEPEAVPELPVEMQLQLVEAVEARQRGVIPKPPARLVEAARIWLKIYEAWKEGRVVKMEHPPKVISLELARLFVSPRFKLVTGMQWPTVRQILEAYIDVWKAETTADGPTYQIFVLYRQPSIAATPDTPGETWGWQFSYLGGGLKHTAESITFGAIIVTHRDLILGFTKGRMKFSSSGPPVITTGVGDRFVRNALIYGRARFVISAHAYAVKSVFHVWDAMRNMFMTDARRFDRPTAGMLAWKDKIVAIRANVVHVLDWARVVGDRRTNELQVDVFYVPRASASGEEEKVTVYASLRRYPLIGDLHGASMLKAESAIKERVGRKQPGPAIFQSSIRIRTEVVWPNGARMELYDSANRDEPERGLAFPERARARDVLQAQVEQMAEPALEPLARNAEWGYEMSMYLPRLPGSTSGMVLMPAPWFFYLVKDLASGGFTLAKGHFIFSINAVALMSLDSDHVLAYQPYELIFLPDELDDRPLEELAMLQRREIAERATAPLVEDKVVLL